MLLHKEFKYIDLDYRYINDNRAIFVNQIFIELAKNVEDVPELLRYLKENKVILNGIYEYVRNVYELNSSQIPLLMLYQGRVGEFGYGGMDFERDEMADVDNFLADVCEHIYFKKF